MRPYNPPMAINNGPEWKRIGEASENLVLSIERIDGYRIPVRRFSGLFESDRITAQQNALDQAEIQNRVRRDIIREAFNNSLEVADYKAAKELRERLQRQEDELRSEEIRREAERFYPRVRVPCNPFDVW
jgi:hypothetical protein